MLSPECHRRCNVSVLAAFSAPIHVRFGSISEVGAPNPEVCFAPMSGHHRVAPACPLSANRRHLDAATSKLSGKRARHFGNSQTNSTTCPKCKVSEPCGRL
jgi:hypothetical protein